MKKYLLMMALLAALAVAASLGGLAAPIFTTSDDPIPTCPPECPKSKPKPCPVHLCG